MLFVCALIEIQVCLRLMKNNSKASQLLQEVLNQYDPKPYDLFNDSDCWTDLSEDEKDQLSRLLILEGRNRLKDAVNGAMDCFKFAQLVTPFSSVTYFAIGMVYSSMRGNMAALHVASEHLEKALDLDPANENILFALAKVYAQKGILDNDLTPFDKAFFYYEKLSELITEDCPEFVMQLYTEWALTLFDMAKISGEACDFFASIEKFKLAEAAGDPDSDFFNLYARVVSDLAILIGRSELLFEAIELHRKSLRDSFDYFLGWLHLGYCYHTLFEITSDEEFYQQAADCYHMAEQIEKDHPVLTFKWAQLLATEGKLQQDYEMIDKALENFEQADQLEPDNPTILSVWAEVLLLHGSMKEDVALLQEAQRKLRNSLDLDAEIAETWYLYGSSFTELGRYFNQEEYYVQAIEKFQYGLKLKENCYLLWCGLAWAYSSIGDLRQELAYHDKAAKFFARAAEFSPHENRQLWNDWAVAYMKMAEITNETHYIETAIKKFEHIIPKDPQEWDNVPLEIDWLYNYGCAYDFLGDFKDDANAYELAIHAMQKVLALDPLHEHARYNMALAMSHYAELTMDIEVYHKTIEQFQLLVAEDGEDDSAWNEFGHTLLNLAELVYEPARPEAAHKLYELAESRFMRALSLGNNNALYSLACVYSLMENYPTAMQYMERAEATENLPSIDMMSTDSWLEGLRTFPAFRQFLTNLSSKKKES